MFRMMKFSTFVCGSSNLDILHSAALFILNVNRNKQQWCSSVITGMPTNVIFIKFTLIIYFTFRILHNMYQEFCREI